jgi:serine/threonine-protein kinase
VIDVAHRDAELLLVLDYVQGLSLAELVKAAAGARARIPPAVASRILADTLSGLAAAHDATDLTGRPLNVVHRDVSPQNILVGADGISRIIDFGIAKAAARLTSTTSGVVKGKLSYMAPEQIKQQPLDRRADVFSAGVVLHELFTGARLFDAGEDGDVVLKVLLGDIPAPTSLAPDLPSAVDPLALKALARHPAERFQSAAELCDALEAACPPAPARDVAALIERLGKETLQKQRTALEAALRQAPGGAPIYERGDDGHAVPARAGRRTVAYPRPRSRAFVVPVVAVTAGLAAVAYLGWPLARRSGAATASASGAGAPGMEASAASAPRANADPGSAGRPCGTQGSWHRRAGRCARAERDDGSFGGAERERRAAAGAGAPPTAGRDPPASGRRGGRDGPQEEPVCRSVSGSFGPVRPPSWSGEGRASCSKASSATTPGRGSPASETTATLARSVASRPAMSTAAGSESAPLPAPTRTSPN